MEDKKIAKSCSGTIAIYMVALGLFLAGYSSPYWTVGSGYRSGLFESCVEVQEETICNRIDHSTATGWFIAVLALMSLALIFSIVAGPVYMFLPLTAAFQLIAAAMVVIATAVYGNYMGSAGLGWSFALSVAGGGLFLINGIVLSVLSGKMGCSMSKLIPGSDKTKVDAVAMN